VSVSAGIEPGTRGELVTVIIPVFNGDRFLADAIESVLAQDHRPIEVIVIDDGSTDSSAEVARSFEEVVLIRSENRGAAAARNLGLEQAAGSFITFLDADDRMAPRRLTAQLDHLEEHPETGCVLMRQELVVEEGAADRSMSLRASVEWPPMTACVRREASELVGGFDPSLRIAHDTDWLFRLRDAGVGIDILPDVGLIRRMHRDNLTHELEVIRGELFRIVRARVRRGRSDPSMPR
jgi:glycosyltransferase involved in cell wall biosynthesis